MKLTPPPGSRIVEVGDRLIARIGPHATRVELVWGGFWLMVWTAAGIAAVVALAGAASGDRVGLIFWLCLWAVIEGGLLASLLWHFFGRELLILTPQRLEVRNELGRFSRTKRYDVALVRDVQARVVPTDEGELYREDFGLRISYGLDTFHVGGGMEGYEAEQLAAALLARIRPRTWWDDDDKPDPAVPLAALPTPSARSRRVRVVLPALVVAAVIGAGIFAAWRSDEASTPAPTADRREHAAETTRSLIAAGGTKVLGEPECAERSSRERWTCTVQGRPTVGPFAGRTVTYRCSGDRRGATCGPQPPLRISSGNAPPQEEHFSDPREYASAATRHSVTSGRRIVLGEPKCAERVTWDRWACTVRAQAKEGPYAGQVLTYRCFLSQVRRVAGRVVSRTIDCGPSNPPPIAG